jgi:hypothetical protein
MIGDSTGVSIAAIAIALAGGWAAWMRLAALFAGERMAREKLADALAAFKLEAARTFATPGAIEKSEERLAVALDRVTARLDAVIGRIEMLSTEMARLAAPLEIAGRPTFTERILP